MNIKKTILRTLSLLIFTLIICVPLSVAIADTIVYKTLAPIPLLGLESEMEIGASDGLVIYFNSVVKLMIALSTGLAVLYMVWGGVQYTMSDVVTSKSAAKSTIWRALGGLVLALTSWLILNTINPALLTGKINNLQNVTVAPVEGGERGEQEATGAGQGIVPVTGGGAATTGQVASTGLSSWGDPAATAMMGQTVNGRQVYYASGEKVSDSNTDAGRSAVGKLIEANPTTVGSAASVYYPAGTLIKTNGLLYVIDDNNLKKNRDGSYTPANEHLTNNYTIDIYTSDKNKANSVDTHYPIEVLYVPPKNVGAEGVMNIRTNPNNYIGS